MWPDWAILESFHQPIFSQKYSNYLETFWAILTINIFTVTTHQLLLGKLSEKLVYHLFQHLIASCSKKFYVIVTRPDWPLSAKKKSSAQTVNSSLICTRLVGEFFGHYLPNIYLYLPLAMVISVRFLGGIIASFYYMIKSNTSFLHCLALN